MREGDVPPQGGKPGWAALPSPRMGPWLRHLKKLAQAHNLVPEFEVFFCFIGTHAVKQHFSPFADVSISNIMTNALI